MVKFTFPFNLTFDGVKSNHSNFKQTRSELAQLMQIPQWSSYMIMNALITKGRFKFPFKIMNLCHVAKTAATPRQNIAARIVNSASGVFASNFTTNKWRDTPFWALADPRMAEGGAHPWSFVALNTQFLILQPATLQMISLLPPLTKFTPPSIQILEPPLLDRNDVDNFVQTDYAYI